MLDPNWAAVFPTDGGLTFYAAMPTIDQLPRFKEDPERALRETHEALPDGPPIREGRRVGPVNGKIDMTNRIREQVMPGLALVGDAALAIDPLWGVGCGWALQSAEWLADSVTPALLRAEPLDAGLARYRKRHRRGLAGHTFLMKDYATGRKLNAARAHAVLRCVTRRAARAALRRVRDAADRAGADVRDRGPALDRGEHAPCAAPARRAAGKRQPGRDGAGMSSIQRTRVAVGGVQVRALLTGPGDARDAVVFVHGNPGSCDDWEALLGALPDGLRGVALDLPDFGETIAPAGFEHTPLGYATFLGQGLAALGIERAHLVLHDFGGPIGLVWAAMNADALASVTLIDTGVMPGYRWHTLARVWRTPVLGELFQATATRRAFRWLVNRQEPRGLPRAFLDQMYDHYDRRTRRAVLKLYRATDDPGAAAEGFSALMAPRDIPALVIWGEGDAYLPSAMAQHQRAPFPSADVHVLADSGHWPFADAPETVERLLVDFYVRVAGAGSAPRPAPAPEPGVAPS